MSPKPRQRWHDNTPARTNELAKLNFSYRVWMKILSDYLQEHPPEEYESEVRAVLVEVRREVKGLARRSD